MALARREKLTGKLPHQTGVKIGLLEKHASELSGLHEDKDRVMALLAEVDRMKDLDPRDCANTSADAETSPRATVANRTDIRSRTVTAWHGRYHVTLVVSGRAQVQCLDMSRHWIGFPFRRDEQGAPRQPPGSRAGIIAGWQAASTATPPHRKFRRVISLREVANEAGRSRR